MIGGRLRWTFNYVRGVRPTRAGPESRAEVVAALRLATGRGAEPGLAREG